MTLQVQVSGTPSPMTDAEKTDVLTTLGAASAASLTAHVSSTSNPHGTTKAQVGLGNVDNTADMDKPVSTAQALAIAAAGGATNLAAVVSPTGVTITSDTGNDAVIPLADATNAGAIAPAQVSKLSGIAYGATANSMDAQLRDRSTHTGAQAISTVTGLQSALDAKATATQGSKADSALQPGVLPVGTTIPLAQVTGAGTAAAQPAGAFATAAQGLLAGTALQPGAALSQAAVTGATSAGVTLLGAVDAAAQRSALGLGTAATAASTAFASAAQGAKADAAYPAPAGGIPKADLAAVVQTSLGKADTALQDIDGINTVLAGAAPAKLATTQALVSGDLEPIPGGQIDFSKTLYSSSVSGATYNAFPHATKIGKTIFIAFRQSGTHLGSIGVLELSKGTPDGGFVTTGIPTVGLPATHDPRDPSLYSESGVLYLTYLTTSTAGSLLGSFIQVSYDSGNTWTNATQISAAYAVCGPIKKIGSEYLMPAYKNPTPNWVSLVVRASSPTGPWSEKATISLSGNDLTEIGFCQLPGSTRLLATIRNESGTKSTMVSTSDDMGTTWTIPAAIKTGAQNYDGWPAPIVSSQGAVYILGRRNGSLMGILYLIDTGNPALAASWVEPSWLSTYFVGIAGTTQGSGRCTPITYQGVQYVIYYTEISAVSANICIGVFDIDSALRKDFSRKDAYEVITNGTGQTSSFPTPTVCYVYSLGGLYTIAFDFMTYYLGTGSPYRVTLSIDNVVHMTAPSDLGMYVGELGPIGSACSRSRSTVRNLSKGWHKIELVAGVDDGSSRNFGGRSLRVAPI